MGKEPGLIGKRIRTEYPEPVPETSPATIEQHGFVHLLPESYEAVTSVNIAGKGWMLVKLKISGLKVTDLEVSEPDMKPLILERQKIEQAKLWRRVSG